MQVPRRTPLSLSLRSLAVSSLSAAKQTNKSNPPEMKSSQSQKSITLSTSLIAATLFASSIAAFGAAQPISGIDISAKKNPGGVPSKPKMAIGAPGGGGPGRLIIANSFFFPGFDSAARFAAPEDLFGEGALPGGAVLRMQRFTEPDFGISLPSYAVDTKILALSVASETPLFIDATHSYDWFYTIQSTTMGQMNLTNADALGGDIISSAFAVSYHVEFTQVGGSGGPLSLNGTDTFAFEGTPDWSNQLPGGGTPPGGTNFALGSDGTTMTGAVISSASGIWAANVQVVPEPSSVVLLLFGAALGLRRRSLRTSERNG